MKINLRKKALSILCASFVFVNSNVYAETKTENDYVYAESSVNIRYSDSIDSNKLGVFKVNDIAYRILSSDNWSLIKYNDNIGYVSAEYISSFTDNDSSYEYYEVNDILYTNENLNFRLGPSIDDKKIGLIKKNTEIIPIAVTNNNWYIVKYNGKIGYVSGDYVRSLKKEFNIDEIKIKDIVYANEELFIYNEYNKIIGKMEKYECAYLLKYGTSYSYVKTDKHLGYVQNKSLKEFDGKLIEIDLTDQNITLYSNNDILIRSDIVTGKNLTPTNVGSFKIYLKEMDRYLNGPDYSSHVDFWMPFDGGIGLHDATWRKKFGGEIYKKNGSHGCVNLPYDVAEFIYDNVSVGTKVLVHK